MDPRKPSTSAGPREGGPALGEFLVQLNHRLSSSLGIPPTPDSTLLGTPEGCSQAARELLDWLDGNDSPAQRQMAELVQVFDTQLQLVERLDGKFRRAVQQTRRWIEDEMTFAQVVGEQLDQSIHPHCRDAAASSALQRILERLEGKQAAAQAEASKLSRQFAAAQQDLAVLRNQLRQVEEHTRGLSRQSLRDGLTGLWNRRAYADRVEEEVSRAQRYGTPLSLALWDVDRLQCVNENHGYGAGDGLLQRIVGRVLGVLRRSDFLARYGGEEFALILANTDLDRALIAAEKIRQAIAGRGFSTDGGAVAVTVSVGVAAHRCGDTPTGLLGRASEALRRAGQAGGNRVAAEDPGPN